VNRINYVVHPLERALARPLPQGIARSLRAPLLVLGVATAFVAVLHAVEAARLRDARDRAARAALALAQVQPALTRVRAVERDVERVRAAEDADDALRRTGTDAANEIARIANALPDDAFLTSIRLEPATIGLDGRARGVDAVATTLAALSRVATARRARLVSARAEPASESVAYTVAVERAP